MHRNVDGLKRSAHLRSEAALTRALRALERMEAADQEINFRSLASEARVSTVWLYNQQELRLRIQRLRSATSRVPPSGRVSSNGAAISRQNIIATLRLRIKTLEERNRQLTEQLERAYGMITDMQSSTGRAGSEVPLTAKEPCASVVR